MKQIELWVLEYAFDVTAKNIIHSKSKHTYLHTVITHTQAFLQLSSFFEVYRIILYYRSEEDD